MEVVRSLEFGGRHYTECSPEYLLAAGVPLNVIKDEQLSQLIAFAQQARRTAYVAEADPLYLEWQYDQTAASEKAWREKVAEIKLRYPLPENQ